MGMDKKYKFVSPEHEAIKMLQSALVANVFTSSVRDRLALKGGLAFQAVMGSERATSDMDLDACKDLPVDRLRSAMRSCISNSIKGLLEDVRVSEPKMTETTCRWKVWGKLPASSSEVHFKLEISRRDSLATPDDAAWFDWRCEGKPVDGVKVKAHKPEILCMMKLKALLSPVREAPRDLHDLHVLIEAGYKPAPELMARLDDKELVEMAQEAWGRVEKMDFSRYSNEVMPYLPPGIAALVDENSYDDMRLRVGASVESWSIEELSRRLGEDASTIPAAGLMEKLCAKRASLDPAKAREQARLLAGSPP